MITAQTPFSPTSADDPPPPVRAALASAIDVQAQRVDQLSAAIMHATSQVTWSGRAAEMFRARAAERSRECLHLAVALRTSAERVNTAAMAPSPPAEYADQPLVPEWGRSREAGRSGGAGSAGSTGSAGGAGGGIAGPASCEPGAAAAGSGAGPEPSR